MFGMLGPLARTVYGLGMTPFAFVAWRAGVGAIVVIGLVAWRLGRPGARLVGWRSLDGRGRASLAVAMLMGSTLNLAMFLAFARAPIAVVLLGFYLYPAIVAAGSSLLGWERLDRAGLTALVVSLAGMAAVVTGNPSGPGVGGPDALGVGLALTAAFSQAAFVLVSRSGYGAVPTDQAMLAVLGVAALIAAAAAAIAGTGPSLVLPLGDPSLLALLVVAGVFAAAIPSLMFLAGIRWIGPVRAGILMLIEPLVGVTLAALLLGESIGPVQVLGGMAILAGAVIIQRARPEVPALLPAGDPETGAPTAALPVDR
jgi:drug/metabolite transporter (DMT)-like permease